MQHESGDRIGGEPVIAIERVAYTYQDRVVEFRRTIGRSDKFRYPIQLS